MTTVDQTLNAQLTVSDLFQGLGGFLKDVLAMPLSREKKFELIEKNKLNAALAARKELRDAWANVVHIKDTKDGRETDLEKFEKEEARIVAGGGKLTLLKQGLEAENVSNEDPRMMKVSAQLGQLSTALDALRNNQLYQQLKATYGSAEETYELAKKNAAIAEAAYKFIRENRPVILNTLEVLERNKRMQEKVEASAVAGKSQDRGDEFIATLQGQIGDMKIETRAFDAVQKDIDAMQEPDPTEDILSQFDAEGASAGNMDEFAKSAAKQAKKAKK